MPGYQDPDCTVFVSNVEGRVTEEHLWELFLQVNIIVDILLIKLFLYLTLTAPRHSQKNLCAFNSCAGKRIYYLHTHCSRPIEFNFLPQQNNKDA